MHYGVDLSSNNDHPLNVAAIGAYLRQLGGGQAFAIVKINQGTGYTNPDAMGDVAALRAAGFAVGGYLMDEGTADPAAEQALYNQVAGGLPQFDDDELPDGLTTAQYIAHLAALIAQKPSVQYLNQSEAAAGYDQSVGLWLAEYNGTPGVTTYPCLIHQYNNVGTIPGCAGQFDLNVFCGSEAQFAAIFGTPTPTPAPTGEAMLSDTVTLTTPATAPGEPASSVDCLIQIGTDGTVYAKARAGVALWSKNTNVILDGPAIKGSIPRLRVAGTQFQATYELAADAHTMLAASTDGVNWSYQELG